MSWETAKTWLIVVFLVLDVLLGWQYVQSRQEAVSYTESYPDLVANTKTLLAAHNFSLQATIPQEHPNLPSLKTEAAPISLDALEKAVFPTAKQSVIDANNGQIGTDVGQLHIETQGTWKVDYSDPPHISSQNSPGILGFVWNASAYQLDKAMTAGQFHVYDEVYHDHPMFDAAIIARETNGMLMDYEQSAAGTIHEVGSPKPTISALDALTSLSNSVDKSESQKDNVIEHITLGYKLKTQSQAASGGGTPSGYWFPVWRIVTSTQQVYYINAFTGEIDSIP